MEIIALLIVIAWLFFTAVFGAIATLKKASKLTSVDSWFVAGRTLGLVVLFLSLGANIYSSYTFLGLPGAVASNGIRAWPVTLYGMLAYVVGYLTIPPMWRYAKDRGWLTIADAFEDLYDSRLVGVFTAITSALWSIPYIQLQIQGVSYIIEVTSYGLVNPLIASVFSFVLIVAFTVVGGLMSIAFINMLQGAIMLLIAFTVGVAVPIIAFGSLENLFKVVIQNVVSNPSLSGFKVSMGFEDILWTITLCLAAPLAFWLWPNRAQNLFGAKDVEVIKKNTVVTSLFQLSQIPIIFAGLTALGLYFNGVISEPVFKKPYNDMSFLLVTKALFPPWVLGLVGAGVVAASISTAAALLHVSGALFTRNVYQKLVGKDVSEQKLLFAARIFTLAIAGVSFILALYSPGVLIYLLLTAHAGIAQFFPAFVLGLRRRKAVNKYVVIASMSAGMLTVLYISAVLGKSPYGVYEGFYGLVVNLTVLAVGYLIERMLSKAR